MGTALHPAAARERLALAGALRRRNENSQNEPGMCPGINTFTFSRLTSPSQIARSVGGARPEADGHGGGAWGRGLHGPPAECARPQADRHGGGRIPILEPASNAASLKCGT